MLQRPAVISTYETVGAGVVLLPYDEVLAAVVSSTDVVVFGRPVDNSVALPLYKAYPNTRT